MTITEKQFAATNTQAAKTWKFKVYHTFFSVFSEPGFPDKFLIKKGSRWIVAEEKSDTGMLSVEQCAWLDYFASNPTIEVYVWRPSDGQEIDQILAGTISYEQTHCRWYGERKQQELARSGIVFEDQEYRFVGLKKTIKAKASKVKVLA